MLFFRCIVDNILQARNGLMWSKLPNQPAEGNMRVLAE